MFKFSFKIEMFSILLPIIILFLLYYAISHEKLQSEDIIKYGYFKKNDNFFKSVNRLNFFIKNPMISVKWRSTFIFTMIAILLISMLKKKIPDSRELVIYISSIFACCYGCVQYLNKKNSEKILIHTNLIIKKIKKDYIDLRVENK